MSKCHTCPRKLITLQSEYIHIILASPHALFPGTEVLKGKTGQLLTGWMRPSFNVALLCQTCQEREMDSYRGRSCIRRGWRGGADSRLTAVINHLPHQPDAGWQQGARWLEWRFVHSLPEMSFCQPVSGGMLSVINPADHISISSFSRVKPVCDMLHFTAMLRSCGTASLIFSEPFAWGRKTANVQHTSRQSLQPKPNHNHDLPFFTQRWRKTLRNFRNFVYSQAQTLWIWRQGSRNMKEWITKGKWRVEKG